MALWMKNGWRIPLDGLKQSIWDATNDLVQFREVIDMVFGSIRSNICKQYVQSQWFNTFKAGFLDKTLSYTVSMLMINVTN